MNSYQLYDNKQLNLFTSEDSDSLIPSKELIQNCSVLQIELQQLLDQSLDTRTLNPIFTFKQLQQLNAKQATKESKQLMMNKKMISIGKEYMNLKSWEEKRKKEQIGVSPIEKEKQKQKFNKIERKRLLEEMIDKLNTNQKTIKDVEVDDSIIEKIQNIVGLLGEVEKEIKVKQKCSLGMKLKLKVDPNQRYFKRKDNHKDQFYYTSREKIHSQKQKHQQKSSLKFNDKHSKQPLQRQHQSVHSREKQQQSPLFKIRKNMDYDQKSPLEFKQKSQFGQRQYGTENLYSTSSSQKKTKHHEQSHDKQRNSVEHTSSLIKQKREQIVEKEMKRREKWYNRNGGKQ